MEQHERSAVDPLEGQTEQGGEDPAPSAVLAGEVAGAKEGEQERVPETHNPVGAAASEGARKQDLDEPSPESDEAAAASANIKSEDREALEDPMETHFEFRSAAADATPPYTSLRARSRKQAGPTKFTAVGAPDGAGSEAPVLGASSSSSPARAAGTHEDFSAMAVPGDTVAIAHASPPDSNRRLPSRNRKQYSPMRFASAGASTSTGAPAAGDPAPPARGRKQPRPEHFIPEEAAATAGAKARRANIVLDRFLSSTMARGSSASDWASDVTAEDAGQPERPRGVESFRIRDASRHAARACGLRVAISRLGASCGGASSPSTAAPGEPEGSGSGRMYGILAVLGASLALSVVSCVLFYLVGRGSEAAPSGENQDKVMAPASQFSCNFVVQAYVYVF
ncbi:unnamed protein product [Triticum turgidum subsp. durum]|uniref:Uncharacterized protein n=2 Tax=Triticum turgidum subsp. durum TaxID=4567 RepID=A0A9R1Q6W0_TRITD|nr:unnamed protein product [Triticum turgidum subsp. durum]